MIKRKSRLTREQVEFYQENGYLQIHNFFDAGEVQAIKATMLAAMEKHRQQAKTIAETMLAMSAAGDEEKARDARLYAKVFEQRVNLWKVDEAMRQIVWHPDLAETARRAGGFRAVRLWHDQALVKPGGDSRPSNWHQDTPYWPMRENGALSIWIALDDVDEANGCMWFIPRSRNLGRLTPQSLAVDDPAALLKLPELQGKLAPPVCMAMKAGGITLHDGLTFHYANANRTREARHAFVIIYMPDGATYNGNPHVCTDGKGLAVGAPLAGEDFPLLAAESLAPAAEPLPAK